MISTFGVFLLVIFLVFVLYLYRLTTRDEETWATWARRKASTKSLPTIVKETVGNTVATLIRNPGLSSTLSNDAKAFVESCYEGIDKDEMMDYHTHIFGTGSCCDSGNYIPEREERTLKVFTVGRVMLKASGCRSESTADEDFVEMLSRLVHGKHVLLAFDKFYKEDGTICPERTHIYTSNEWVLRMADKYNDRFVPSCSVHPYRHDALEELEKAYKSGVKLIKWLPNSMGMDPASPLCDPFYEKVAEYDMVILAHAGEERAVEADPRLQELGNPQRMARALDKGVKVIIAHLGTLGTSEDLESPLDPKPQVPCFDLFIRMLEKKQWEHLLWGDISAICLVNRMKYCNIILGRTDIHHRLVNGSDYPLVNVRVLNLTLPFVTGGLITNRERVLLNEIYEYNPLLYDFCLKRTMRGKNGEKFPPSMFVRNRKIF